MKLGGRNSSRINFTRRDQSLRCLTPIWKTRLFAVSNADDGHPYAPVLEEDSNTNHAPSSEPETFFSKWSPPKYLWRGLSVPVLAGQVIIRTLKGKVHWRNTLQQLERVGPKSVGVCLLTSAFVGMAFTIQFVREFTRLGLNRSVGGVLALAFSRELSPVVTSIVVAGRIGSAFAAELGTMQVSEQTDTLRVLGSNPVDYLVTPRVIASSLALPFLTLMCFTVGMASSALLADSVYGISINIILDSAQRALRSWDIISAMIKSQVFGMIISIVSCAWGVTTMGGAKGVGESTTSAVVISLVVVTGAKNGVSFLVHGFSDALNTQKTDQHFPIDKSNKTSSPPFHETKQDFPALENNVTLSDAKEENKVHEIADQQSSNDKDPCSAIYVPFYAGLDVGRYLWDYNISVRDSSASGLVNWLAERVEWQRMWGRDHFFVSGRIAWDFRRQSDNESDWGSNLMSLPESMNMTMLSIESTSWSNEFAIPYPTYFHPSSDSEVIRWKKRMRSRKRRYLFSFAGAPRPGMNDSIRGDLINQCLASKSTCKFLNCRSGAKKCDDPVEVIKVFRDSIFCLQPSGDSYTRRSTFDSILAGCIPVFFHPYSAYAQYIWYFPRNYSKYSVYIPEADIKDSRVSLKEALSRFTKGQILAMRKEVVKLIPKVIYAVPGSRLERFEDAFDIAVNRVVERVEKVRKDTKEGKDPGVDFAVGDRWKLKLSGVVGDHPLEQSL
ncbi:hypothetical protein COLO4_08690 [Corchorus olitorius]|uniref:Exostosin GT47 domain-containing protein n=1 Tax=Corchorus olitorius TaxID=93759 RepID=A0A1R3KEW4_9ROSI|nr:hypothetical protein COLO4_08690 [Corchorus olitorius]